MLRGSHRDARRQRRDGLVADVLVDQVGCVPEQLDVDPGVEPDSGQRLRDRLGRDAVHRQRDRIDRGRDHVGARARAFDRGGERVATRALRVEADRQRRDLAQLVHELAGPVRLQQRRRVVEEDPRGTQLRQPLRRVDERLVTAAAVEQPGLELLARADDRLGGLTQVVDVVQRIVEAEDVDPALGGAGDEPPGEVAADGTRADEKPPAQGERQRRRRSRLQRADALPRALDASPDRVVEDAAARDLEVREARAGRGSRPGAGSRPSASGRRAVPG